MLSSTQIDNIVFDSSFDIPSKAGHPILKKDLSYVHDSSMQNYSGSSIVNYDAVSFASSGKWLSYREGFLLLPMVLTCTGSLPASVGQLASNIYASHCIQDADLMLGLKNSHLNMVHSCQILCNGVIIQTNFNYANSLLIFKKHCRTSMESVRLNGEFDGYFPDSSNTWSFSEVTYAGDMQTGIVADGNGLGLSNNRNIPINDSLSLVGDYNVGFRERQNRFQNNVQSNGRHHVFPPPSKRTNVDRIQNDAANNTKVYYYSCYIKLRDLSSFFDNMPLSKNVNISIQLTLNNNVQFKIRRTITRVGAVDTNSTLEQLDFQNPVSDTNTVMFASSGHDVMKKTVLFPPAVAGTAPVLLNDQNKFTVNTINTTVVQGSSICANLPSGNDTVGTVDFLIKTALCKNGIYEHDITSTRLYIPSMILNPSYEQLYIANSIRDIEYEDVTHSVFNCDSNSSVQQLLNSGLTRLKSLVIIPMLYNDILSNGSQNLHSMSSAFSCEPCCTSPGCLVSNFQVYVGVTPIYQQPITYSFENFVQSANGAYGLNSNQDDLVCGLIDASKFTSNYGYIVANLDRRNDAEENVSNSITVSLTNLCRRKVQYHCYLIRSKNVQINVLTGERRDASM